MTELGLRTTADNVFLTAGAQNALVAIFAAEARTGDLVATEEYAYPGVRAVTEILGLRLEGVTLDEEGIVPDAFEELCRSREVRLLYLNPSLQNPTNAVMSLSRREKIAAVAEKYGVLVVEDEILSPLLDDRPGYLTNIIPSRCFFILSSSKTVAAGLRVGFVSAPKDSYQRLVESTQTLSLGQPSLMAEVFARWFEDGTVAKTIASRKKELTWRHKLTSELIDPALLRSHLSSYHVWLRLPENWTALEFAREALMRGVSVAPSDIFAADRRTAVNAVRLSIGSVPNREFLRSGLEILAGMLAGVPRTNSVKV
jgi:DNA-binding transcriptional MocR family regulator